MLQNTQKISLYTLVPSPLGDLLIVSDGEVLTGLYLRWEATFLLAGKLEESLPLFHTTQRQLEAYFAGELQEFELPLNPQGSPFQRRVWEALQTIPYGTTLSYGQVAQQIDQPKASRAVGLANSKNPISIIIPCHRVIGANGKLTGYSGGVAHKQSLLELEAQVLSGKPYNLNKNDTGNLFEV